MADDDEGTQSWDAFWAEVSGQARTETIRGVKVTVPADLPLRVVVRAEQLAESTSLDDVGSLLVDIFGVDVLDAWTDAGMGALELRTVLAWASAHGSGKQITFGEALALVRGAEAGEAPAPVPPNRASRRATSRTGGRSKPTSPANTGSHRRASGR